MFRRKKTPEPPLPPLPDCARAADVVRMEWGNTYMEEMVFPSGERLLPSGEIIPPPDDNHQTGNSSESEQPAQEAVAS